MMVAILSAAPITFAQRSIFVYGAQVRPACTGRDLSKNAGRITFWLRSSPYFKVSASHSSALERPGPTNIFNILSGSPTVSTAVRGIGTRRALSQVSDEQVGQSDKRRLAMKLKTNLKSGNFVWGS